MESSTTSPVLQQTNHRTELLLGENTRLQSNFSGQQISSCRETVLAWNNFTPTTPEHVRQKSSFRIIPMFVRFSDNLRSPWPAVEFQRPWVLVHVHFGLLHGERQMWDLCWTFSSRDMFVAREIPAQHKDLIHDVSYDFHGRRMATCSSDQSVKVWLNVPWSGRCASTFSWKFLSSDCLLSSSPRAVGGDSVLPLMQTPWLGQPTVSPHFASVKLVKCRRPYRQRLEIVEGWHSDQINQFSRGLWCREPGKLTLF